ncbi:hypothetical protein [Methanocalculus sp. MSAO_Arc2]|uniref:hypothetical protein n=1 Tax=Methanocalculus sp. MSAO_Arc2 TaxID=2293855 RepID=UPI003216B518
MLHIQPQFTSCQETGSWAPIPAVMGVVLVPYEITGRGDCEHFTEIERIRINRNNAAPRFWRTP